MAGDGNELRSTVEVEVRHRRLVILHAVEEGADLEPSRYERVRARGTGEGDTDEQAGSERAAKTAAVKRGHGGWRWKNGRAV